MTGNRDITATHNFHTATKYVRVPPAEGRLPIAMGAAPKLEDAIWEEDWSLEPFPYKVYETLRAISLPREFPRSSVPALTALTAWTSSGDGPVDRSLLARIALHTNGLLDRPVPRRDGTVHRFRTAGGTGERYHLELYFVCDELADLPAGVYHYDAREHCLRCLRIGDFRSVLADATGAEPAVASAPVILAMTSTFWRNAWRYKARAYRHAFWDAGTSMSHVLAVSASAGVAARVVLGFADVPINRLLGIDGEREATVALCAVGSGAPSSGPAPAVPTLDLPVKPISPREVTFPDIPAMHHASELSSGAEARTWRDTSPICGVPEPGGELITLAEVDQPVADRPVEEIIFRRRSTRNYDDAPTPFDAFSTLLRTSAAGFSADFPHTMHRLYLIVNRVDGLTPGVYVHHPGLNAVELLREGDFRADAQRLAVGQEYTARAHVNCYYLTELGPVLERFGNRGYRAAQLECALHAGRMHLATHMVGCGAVGSTSYDDEVVDFFSPHAARVQLHVRDGVRKTPAAARLAMVPSSGPRHGTLAASTVRTSRLRPTPPSRTAIDHGAR